MNIVHAAIDTYSRYRSPKIFICDYDYERGKKARPPVLNLSIVTNALPLISRNSFSPMSCQRTARHSKDYALSHRHLVGTFQ